MQNSWIQTDTQTDTQKVRQTDKDTARQTDKYTDQQTVRQTMINWDRMCKTLTDKSKSFKKAKFMNSDRHMAR